MKHLKSVLCAAALAATQLALVQPAAVAAPPKKAPVVTDRAIRATQWSDLHEVLPANHAFLLEGSYLGNNRDEDGDKKVSEYRLHLLAYGEHQDTFVALLESEPLNLAVLGFVERSDNDNSYLWREISVDRDFENLQPRPTKAPMYRIKPRYDESSNLVAIEVVSTNPEARADTVTLTQARSPLMRGKPAPGRYMRRYKNGASWKIDVSPSPSNTRLWLIDQTFKTIDADGHSSAGNETGLARYELPGVMVIRKTVNEGYQSQTSETIKMVAVSVTRFYERVFSDYYDQKLILFKIQGSDAAEQASDHNQLVRPALGQHLFEVKP